LNVEESEVELNLQRSVVARIEIFRVMTGKVVRVS
jgi:hypothetical protein